MRQCYLSARPSTCGPTWPTLTTISAWPLRLEETRRGTELLRSALAIAPTHFGGLVNLGNAYKDQGLAAEAVTCYRRALVVRPDDARIHSNLVLALNYLAGVAPQEILAEARRFAEQYAAPLASAISPTLSVP